MSSTPIRRSRRTRGERPEIIPPKSDEEPEMDEDGDYVDPNTGNVIALGVIRGKRRKRPSAKGGVPLKQNAEDLAGIHKGSRRPIRSVDAKVENATSESILSQKTGSSDEGKKDGDGSGVEHLTNSWDKKLWGSNGGDYKSGEESDRQATTIAVAGKKRSRPVASAIAPQKIGRIHRAMESSNSATLEEGERKHEERAGSAHRMRRKLEGRATKNDAIQETPSEPEDGDQKGEGSSIDDTGTGTRSTPTSITVKRSTNEPDTVKPPSLSIEANDFVGEGRKLLSISEDIDNSVPEDQEKPESVPPGNIDKSVPQDQETSESVPPANDSDGQLHSLQTASTIHDVEETQGGGKETSLGSDGPSGDFSKSVEDGSKPEQKIVDDGSEMTHLGVESTQPLHDTPTNGTMTYNDPLNKTNENEHSDIPKPNDYSGVNGTKAKSCLVDEPNEESSLADILESDQVTMEGDNLVKNEVGKSEYAGGKEKTEIDVAETARGAENIVVPSGAKTKEEVVLDEEAGMLQSEPPIVADVAMKIHIDESICDTKSTDANFFDLPSGLSEDIKSQELASQSTFNWIKDNEQVTQQDVVPVELEEESKNIGVLPIKVGGSDNLKEGREEEEDSALPRNSILNSIPATDKNDASRTDFVALTDAPTFVSETKKGDSERFTPLMVVEREQKLPEGSQIRPKVSRRAANVDSQEPSPKYVETGESSSKEDSMTTGMSRPLKNSGSEPITSNTKKDSLEPNEQPNLVDVYTESETVKRADEQITRLVMTTTRANADGDFKLIPHTQVSHADAMLATEVPGTSALLVPTDNVKNEDAEIAVGAVDEVPDDKNHNLDGSQTPISSSAQIVEEGPPARPAMSGEEKIMGSINLGTKHENTMDSMPTSGNETVESVKEELPEKAFDVEAITMEHSVEKMEVGNSTETTPFGVIGDASETFSGDTEKSLGGNFGENHERIGASKLLDEDVAFKEELALTYPFEDCCESNIVRLSTRDVEPAPLKTTKMSWMALSCARTICSISSPGMHESEGSPLDRAKLILYSVGNRVHRGKGFERIFADYWDAVCLRLSDRLSSHSYDRCNQAISRFLSSQKLRRIHNRFIFGIMKQANRAFARRSEIASHIPVSWQNRVKVKVTEGIGDSKINQSSPPLPLLEKHFLGVSDVPHPVRGRTYKEPWEITADSNCDTSPDILFTQGMNHSSSRIPGAIVVHPLLRQAAEERGLQSSNSAMWLLVIALREHIKNILKGSIAHKMALEKGELHPQFLHYPNVLASNARKDGKNRPQASSVRPGTDEQNHEITTLDISLATMGLPASQVGSLGGAVSRVSLEQTIQSAFQLPPPTLSGTEFRTMRRYLTKEMLQMASFDKSASSKPAEESVTMTSWSHTSGVTQPMEEPVLENCAQIISNEAQQSSSGEPLQRTNNDKRVTQETETRKDTEINFSRTQSSRTAIDDLTKQRPTAGAGRGAKNLAALMARAWESSKEGPSGAMDESSRSVEGKKDETNVTKTNNKKAASLIWRDEKEVQMVNAYEVNEIPLDQSLPVPLLHDKGTSCSNESKDSYSETESGGVKDVASKCARLQPAVISEKPDADDN